MRRLNKILRNDGQFQRNENFNTAFEKIKASLVSQELLIYADFEKPFNLTTDASMEALEAVLSQGLVGKDIPIAYVSRTLKPAERRYSTTEKELLVIV